MNKIGISEPWRKRSALLKAKLSPPLSRKSAGIGAGRRDR